MEMEDGKYRSSLLLKIHQSIQIKLIASELIKSLEQEIKRYSAFRLHSASTFIDSKAREENLLSIKVSDKESENLLYSVQEEHISGTDFNLEK